MTIPWFLTPTRSSFQGHNEMEQTVSLLGGGWLRLLPSFYSSRKADVLFDRLLHETSWENHRQPRLIKWVGDFDYAYTGVSHKKVQWTPILLGIRRDVQKATFDESRAQFKGVLMNLYRDGNDSVGYHTDAEPTLKPDSPIASLSLGAARRFLLKYIGPIPTGEEPPDVVEVELTHGSLLIMGGTTQRFWKHSIPKQLRITKPRVNLTFREYNVGA